MQSAVNGGTSNQMAMKSAVFRSPKSLAPSLGALPCGSSITTTNTNNSKDAPSTRSQ